MRNPHAILVPFPAQGHIIPFMELSHCLAKRNFKITFVNTEFNHKRILTALQQDNKNGQINLVSIQDGLADEERHSIGNLFESMKSILPVKVEEIISLIKSSDDEDDITCIISDMAGVLEVAEKRGIHKVSLWTASAGSSALALHIPKLIHEGIIHLDGTLIKNQLVQITPEMPAMKTTQFAWLSLGDIETQKICFETMMSGSQTVSKIVDWRICNSTYELEPAAFALVTQLLPIGPLHTDSQLGQSLGILWPEDSTCLNWLDQQPAKSVIYVAFGSSTFFDRTQFQEMALGLELSGQAFLWVVGSDITSGFV